MPRHPRRARRVARPRTVLLAASAAAFLSLPGLAMYAVAATFEQAPAATSPHRHNASSTGVDAAAMTAMPGMATSAAGPAPAAATSTATARTDGRWSDPATWGGAVPAAGAAVVVPTGRTVTLDAVSPALRTVVVKGTLAAAQGATIGLTADAVVVRGGTLRIGTQAAPFTGRATITLTGSTAADNPGAPGMGNKVLALMDGTLDLHGRPVTRSWTRLAADAGAGASRLTLAAAPGWSAGDRVVVATSSVKQDDAEVATVASVDGRVVTLAAPLKRAHLGAVRTVDGVAVDVRAEVGLLSHNIVVQGDDASVARRLGGHAMFMAATKGSVRIERAEFRAMGQYDRLGRYPVHFHVMGTRCDGCYVRDTAVHDTVQRGIVLHDTAGVTLEGNVVYNTVGHNVVVETERTDGNVLRDNLALVNRQPVPSFTEPTLRTQNDRMPSNFWFRSPANTVSGNHAAGSFDNGFTYDGIDGRPISFSGNTVHAAQSSEGIDEGDFDILAGVLVASAADRPGNDVLRDTLAYHNTTALWAEESGTPIVFDGFVLAANGTGFEPRGAGNRATFRNGVVLATLPGANGGNRPNPDPFAVQYGSDMLVSNVRFGGWKQLAMVAHDASATRSNIILEKVGWVGTPGKVVFDVDTRVTALDGSLGLKPGLYVPWQATWLQTQDCTVLSKDPEGGMAWCPTSYRYGTLQLKPAGSGTANDTTFAQVLRSDGLRYDGAVDAASGIAQTFDQGYPVIIGAGLTYGPASPRAGGYAVRTLPAEAAYERFSMPVAIPVTAAPARVLRDGGVDDGQDDVPPGRPLTAVTSRAAVTAGTYWYDAAAKVVWVVADDRWVTVA